MTEVPKKNPETKETLDDNALKFTLDDISPELLQEYSAKSFLLTTNWLEMGDKSEKKLVYKKHVNGDVEMLLIQKFTDENGHRTVPPKETLNLEQYNQLLGQSVRRVEKMRSEFDYVQNDTTFKMKYDEFIGSELRILEVDTEIEADRESFISSEFPSELTNVTGKIEFYGYRVADLV